MKNIENIMKFIGECEKLKTTYRYGVKNDGIKESTAEHSWRLVLLVLLVGKEIGKDLDLFKSIKIAIVHDLAEAITGDLDAYEAHKNKDLKIQKEKNELKAMNYFKDLLGGELGEEIYSYWREYEDGSTKESKFVKALDKIETLNQFCDAGINIFDFVDFISIYADKHVAKVPELKEVLDITKRKLKKSYEKWGFERKKEYDEY